MLRPGPAAVLRPTAVVPGVPSGSATATAAAIGVTLLSAIGVTLVSASPTRAAGVYGNFVIILDHFTHSSKL